MRKGQEGFGILQVLIVTLAASAAVYFLSQMMVNNNRFQSGLMAAEDLQELADEAQLATRNYNFCGGVLPPTTGPGVVKVAGAIQPPGSNLNPASISFTYPGVGIPFLAGPPMVSPPIVRTNVTVQSVQLVPVLTVSVPTDGNTQYLAEVRITGMRNRNASGGPVTRVFPMYLLMNGTAIQQCFSTAYMEPITNASPAPTPPLTFEDQLCTKIPQITQVTGPSGTPTPTSSSTASPSPTPTVIQRYDPWPPNSSPLPSTSRYCNPMP